MKRRLFTLSVLSPIALAACGGGSDAVLAPVAPAAPVTPQSTAAAAIKRAVSYMDEVVSYKGGYVWSYSPDLKQTFGEMEAKRTMLWLQPPGTSSIGHTYLDAYHAIADERFYEASDRTAKAVAQAQQSSGGWNYIYDFASEASLKNWYDTVGMNGWRLEEFQHYYGNATFDDATTAVAAQLMLRMYLEKKDPVYLAATEKAIKFVVDAQFGAAFGIADGGWPQRFPVNPNAITAMPLPNAGQLPAGARAGMEDSDYTLHVTFNDDVMGENIKFLTMCVMTLGRKDLVPNIIRAMDCMQRMQWTSTANAAQSGWSLQHLSRTTNGRPAGAPAGARSYEPRSLATHTTQTNIQQLLGYFTLTGDKKYLSQLQKAITWLKSASIQLPANIATINPLLAGRNVATFIELDSNDPLYIHRYGSNIHNGAYFFDKDITNTISHYSSGRTVNTAALQKTLDEYNAMTPAQIDAMVAKSPLKATTARTLPKYFTAIREVDFPDLFEGAIMKTPVVLEADAKTIVDALVGGNYWTAPVPEIVNPYVGNGPSAAYTGTAYRSRHVGDVFDTSPYPADIPPDIAPYVKLTKPEFIVTSNFIARIGRLISFVSPVV